MVEELRLEQGCIGGEGGWETVGVQQGSSRRDRGSDFGMRSPCLSPVTAVERKQYYATLIAGVFTNMQQAVPKEEKKKKQCK